MKTNVFVSMKNGMINKNKHSKSNFGLRNKIKWEFPDLKTPMVSLRPESSALFKEFKKNGAISIRTQTTIDVADYIYRTYAQPCQNKIYDENVKEGDITLNDEGNRKFAISLFSKDVYPKAFIIPFSDPMISKLLFDDQITGIIYNYFHRQPFYTRPPLLRLVDAKAGDMNVIGNGAGRWHSHHYHPVVLMLNLHNLTMEDTHLEVVKGTHKVPLLKDGQCPSIDDVESEVKKYNASDIYHGVGPAGTVHIFDSRAYHRAHMLKEAPRTDLHMHINTGQNIYPGHGISKDAFLSFKSIIKKDFNNIGTDGFNIAEYADQMLQKLRESVQN